MLRKLRLKQKMFCFFFVKKKTHQNYYSQKGNDILKIIFTSPNCFKFYLLLIFGTSNSAEVRAE